MRSLGAVVEPLTPGQQALVGEYLALPTRMANHYARRYPEMEREELRSIANEALVLAARRFDPSDPSAFEAFAYLRIDGALTRACTRAVFGPGRRVMVAVEHVHSEEEPTDPGLGAALSGGPAEARQLACKSLRLKAASMIAAAAIADTAPGSENALVARESWTTALHALERAAQKLSPEEAHLVELYYRKGLTLDQVAENVGATRRTVQRWLDTAKARLAGELVNAGVNELPVRVE